MQTGTKRLRSAKRPLDHFPQKSLRLTPCKSVPESILQPPDSRLILLWIRPRHRALAHLSLNLLREVCGFLSFWARVVDLGSDYVRYFDTGTQQWQSSMRLSCSLPGYKYSARWLVVEDGRVFYTGGQDASTGLLRGTYAVERTGRVEAQAQMLQGRAYHGLVQWKELLLAFGGSPDAKESEGLPLQSVQSWQAIAPMPHPHLPCSVCLYHEAIYLCGYESRAVDAFLPLQNRYLAVFVLAPSRVYCMYVDREKLTFHAAGSIEKCQAKGQGRLVRSSLRRVENERVFPCSAPVADAVPSLVFFVSPGRCHVYNTDKRIRLFAAE